MESENHFSYYDEPFLSTLPEDIYHQLPDIIYVKPETNYKPIEIYLDDYIINNDDINNVDTDEEYEGRVLLTGPFSCPSLKFVLEHIDKHGIRTKKNVFKRHIGPWIKKCPKYKNKYYKILREQF